MTIIIEDIHIPQTGVLEIHRTVEIGVSADEAHRRCNIWLANDVNMGLLAQQPTLILQENPVWRLPIVLAVASVGVVGVVGQLHIDSSTGEILYTQEQIEHMLNRAEELTEQLPAFHPQPVPQTFLA